MTQQNIFDLKNLNQKTSLNWDKNETNDKVYWSEIKIVKTDPEKPNIIFYKDSYRDEESFKKICILNKGRKSIEVNIKEIHLQQLYKELLPLTKKKYEHLKFLCDKNAILPSYHPFFRNLPFSEHIREPDENDN